MEHHHLPEKWLGLGKNVAATVYFLLNLSSDVVVSGSFLATRLVRPYRSSHKLSSGTKNAF